MKNNSYGELRIIISGIMLVMTLQFFSGNLFAKSNSLPAEKNNTLKGIVSDSLTNEALIRANVLLLGTSLGAATDRDGEYMIANVPDGTYKVRISYVGYTTKDLTVEIKGNQIKHLNVKLIVKNIEGRAVVITGQASGQKQAINKQLTSDQIENVVSAAKIQELPDANAAESVGRLPGVSITRSGGEGTEVVIRGLEPKYNSVTIDGIKMSSTNGDDRSTDLSMISSNMLDGIEVSKTVTPDMDADVLGGTVNFDLHEANVKTPGVAQYSLQFQGGYNNLPDINNRYNNYKYIGSFENRYFDNLFGIFAQVDVERKNLTSNEMGASYDRLGSSNTAYKTTGIALNYIGRDKQRHNGALVLDYKIPDGKIKLTNFFSADNTNYKYRQENYDITNNNHYYNFSGSNEKLAIITNGLGYEQQLPFFQVNVKVSHSFSETKSPDNWAVSFLQNSAGLSSFINTNSVNPQDVPRVAAINNSKTFLNTVTTGNSYSKEQQFAGTLDLKKNVNISDLVSAEIKVGGKYRYQKRLFNTESYDNGGGSLTLGGQATIDNLIKSSFNIPADYATMIPVTYFFDSGFSYGKFLKGDYLMHEPLSFAKMMQIINVVKSNYQYIISQNAVSNYGRNNFASTTNNYDGHENLSAFYLMGTIKIGQELTVIPGVRNQNLQTTYTGVRGVENKQSYLTYNHYDTTVTQNHNYWLPDVSVKYKPFSWFDVRMSYSNTIAYPDYSSIIPRIDVTSGSIVVVDYNNPQLKPSRSSNYDLYFSFYNNSIGLFTIGGFLKHITDFIYGCEFHINGSEAYKYLPLSIYSGSSSKTYTVYTNYNNSYKINDYGMELDWQTNFWYLPGVLSSLVFNVNYTHIFSKAEYPFVYTYTPRPGYSPVYIDSSYTDRLLYQPDDIINMSLGIDYKAFSARVSLLYQSDIFTGTNFWPQLRSHTAAYRRWDFSAKQGLPWYGIEVYGDINNINSEDDISVIQAGVPSSQQNYGMTADIGIKIKF